MNDFAIRTESLGKQYSLPRGRRSDLRETLMRSSRAPEASSRWALRHVSLGVRPGETVGIIGHNGGGKSTLLRLLARITCPTEGRFETRGRVAALLDPGAGLHAELTGLENIYLYATLQGMDRREINRNLAGIIEFAGLRAFLNTPLKHYSSGMHIRLAFSIFAHVDADILMVDDVLDEADAVFQEAFRSRMLESENRGRTRLFVSHDLAFLERLCSRGIVLEGGCVVFDGAVTEAVDYYRSCTMLVGESLRVSSGGRCTTWR